MSFDTLKAVANLPEKYHAYLDDMSEKAFDKLINDTAKFTNTIDAQEAFYASLGMEPCDYIPLLKQSVVQAYEDAVA